MHYLGGKALLAKRFAPILIESLRRTGGRFVEPFVGAFNIVPALGGQWTSARCSDIHGGLISMYKALQLGWDPPSEISEEEYHRLREAKAGDYVSTFASFACSFAGIEWQTYARDAEGKNYAAAGRRSLLKKARSMRGVEFHAHDYRGTPLHVLPTTIYCDPPYNNTHGYKVGPFDSAEFYQWCRHAAGRGHEVLVSEFSAPDGFEVVWEFERILTVSVEARRRGVTRVDKLYRARP